MSHSDAGGSCSISSVTGTKSGADWAFAGVDPAGASAAPRMPVTSRTMAVPTRRGICIATLLANPG